MVSEDEYFSMVNKISKDSLKNETINNVPLKNKPIYEYKRDNNGKIKIDTINNNQNDLLIEDDIEILNELIDEYIKNAKKINIEIKMYKMLYNDTKKEIYKNQINSLKQKLNENKLKIKTLNKLKGEY